MFNYILIYFFSNTIYTFLIIKKQFASYSPKLLPLLKYLF